MDHQGGDNPELARRQREERMRYEVLALLHRAACGSTERETNAWSFALDLGMWHAELFRVVDWLERRGLVRYCGAGPTICLTPAGAEFVELGARERHSIREP